MPGRHRVDQFLQAQVPQRAQNGGDVAVRQAAGDLERPVQGRGGRLALSTRDSASTLASGQDDRLARVPFFTFPASR